MKKETNNLKLNELLSFALDAAWQAGQLTLGYFQRGVGIDRKADNTPVTVADREAEQLLRRLIGEQYPEHDIVGEEYGRSDTNARYRWILDPIDGTKSFVAGVPLYSNLVAVADGDEVIVGIMHFPALKETIYASKRGGCFWNGRPARVSQTEKLADAVLLTSGLNYFGEKQAAWNRLRDASYIQRTWGDAYGYALVATGRADVMVDPAMSLWDIAPLGVIMEEAGGTLTDWQGTPTIYNEESIATNGRLLDEVLTTIQK